MVFLRSWPPCSNINSRCCTHKETKSSISCSIDYYGFISCEQLLIATGTCAQSHEFTKFYAKSGFKKSGACRLVADVYCSIITAQLSIMIVIITIWEITCNQLNNKYTTTYKYNHKCVPTQEFHSKGVVSNSCRCNRYT